MNTMFKNIIATLIAAAVIGNVTILFQFGQRLSSIESQLKFLTKQQTNLSQR